MSDSSSTRDRFKLQSVAFFGRTLAEYLEMFALDLEDLHGMKILDVASGPGSFVAEALAMGLDATGCDPMYAQDAATIAAHGKRDIDACREQIRKNPGVLVYRDIEEFYGEKYRALEKFVADFRHRRDESRYVAGALPELPFEDQAFDLTLSANFLLIYAPLADGGMHDGEEFGLEFHRRAFRELARVTRRELRVPGLHTWTQPPGPHPYGEPMRAELEALGFVVELVPSTYDDGCNVTASECHRVLVARRSRRTAGGGQLIMLGMAPLATADDDWQENYARKEHESGGQTLRYRLLTPKPPADGGKLPLVVFLHGAGERGADNTAQLRHGASDFERRQEQQPCFVLIPQCPANKRWVEVHWGGKAGTGTFPAEPSVPLAQTIEVVDDLVASGAVDPDRVYITGLSMGGYGTWYAAGMPGRRFAAAAPMCGGGDPLWAARYVDLPIWAFHGDLDTTVLPVRSREMIDAIRAAGGDPKYTEYQRVGHNCWAQTYADDAFHEWLFSKRRPAPQVK